MKNFEEPHDRKSVAKIADANMVLVHILNSLTFH